MKKKLTVAEAGKIGGSKKSEAKAIAARLNARKPRPRSREAK